ncbi:MAG: sel1 repeat family protein [Atopobiaceae bacterium]|nr:sel1 repeat family protein [Atopobiaceae bacterium]MBR1828446.1 sel1 repeat family protein [Atopobiaceae bacterium]
MGAAKKQANRTGRSKGSQTQYYLGDMSRYLGRTSRNGEPMTQEEAVKSLLLLGQVSLNAKDYESAVEAYASILKLEPNVIAFYNLGSLYARGLGVKRDYVEAARLLHQAELLGNEKAGKLCGKCMFDYVCDGLESRAQADVYAAMAVFVSRVYPEAEDQKLEVNNGLLVIAATLLNQGELIGATKVFGAAAEFGNDERAQHYLALLADAGASMGEDD